VEGLITEIQRFCVHDGPGIRATVFLKGCPLRCAWCHNPETFRRAPEIQVFQERCIGCGECVKACLHDARALSLSGIEYRRESCQACGACGAVCCSQATVLTGRAVSPEAVIDEAIQDLAFYRRSGGGITLSGGEPLLQPEFCGEVLGLARRQGIGTAIESSLAAHWARLAAVLPLLDVVMFDIKAMTPDLHRQATGVDNGLILENARRLAEMGTPLIIRTPVVPGYTDSPGEIQRIARFIGSFKTLLYYELLPFHPLAAGKYRSLGLVDTCAGIKPPDRVSLDHLAGIARAEGIQVRVA
jgi:pyruvate formate lyase activating enzyme